ncbi:hypothetical protein KP509_02G090100 [Ceratopteris richardii]|nr:hypothetical protein KP509_02G090100 [Ceratopteris richardii]
MTRAFDHHAYFLNARNGRLIDRSARCSDEVSSDVKHSRVVSLPSSPLSLLSSSSSSSSSSSPSPSSPSSSSSISDLFRIEEHEPVEFVDERIKPRFRFLADLY